MPLAAIVGMIVDGLSVANALMPLVQREASGGAPVTEDEVRQALAGKNDALKRFDDAISQAGG